MFQQFFSSLPNKTGLYGRRDTYRGPSYSSRSYGYRDGEETNYRRDGNDLDLRGQLNDYYGSPASANYKGDASNGDVSNDSQGRSSYDNQRDFSYENPRSSTYRGQVISNYGNQAQSSYDDQRGSLFYTNQDASNYGNNYSNIHAESPYRSGRPYGSSYDIFDAPASAYGSKNGSERCIPKCFAEKGNRVKY